MPGHAAHRGVPTRRIFTAAPLFPPAPQACNAQPNHCPATKGSLKPLLSLQPMERRRLADILVNQQCYV
ncbi:hypothetical protein [Kingella sp. (in: b-proteobacteria)]|uniref:hypothetical protein n=1 Tax=Kingella sp. (in: b-proteobacteria) TaxID=2020713 RepID=UPI0026DC4DAD|nr:hypothetical protein [Kingella sp. (in: b-proteobacteria)]MDO4656260.1 hypothetical protein [Kingella sp. (in: b-proteobacteria)]